MAMGYGFHGLSMHKDVLSAGVGVAGGGLQIGLTMAADSMGSLGTPWASSVGTNGQIINLGTGLVATTFGFLGVAGRTFMARHEDASSFLLGYGLTTVIGGWLVPWAVKQLLSGSAGAAYGPGYPPPPTPAGIPFNTAPQATQENIGITSALSS